MGQGGEHRAIKEIREGKGRFKMTDMSSLEKSESPPTKGSEGRGDCLNQKICINMKGGGGKMKGPAALKGENSGKAGQEHENERGPKRGGSAVGGKDLANGGGGSRSLKLRRGKSLGE